MRSSLAALAVLALIASGCSSDDTGDTQASTTIATRTTTPGTNTTSTTVARTTTDQGDDSSFDLATAELLIDAHDQAWLDNDPEAVGALLAADGVFVDLTGGESLGREAIVRYAERHVKLIPESRRAGPVEVQEEGTFVYPCHLVVTGLRSGTDNPYTRVAVVAIEDGLLARYDLSQLTRTSGS